MLDTQPCTGDLCIVSEVVRVTEVLLQLSVGFGGFRGCIGFLKLSVDCGGFRSCIGFVRSVDCGGFRSCIGFVRLSVGCGGFYSKSCGCREFTIHKLTGLGLDWS